MTALKPCGCPFEGADRLVGEHQIGHRSGCRYDRPLGVPDHWRQNAESGVMVAPHTLYVTDDGGRRAAGYKGSAPGDCAARALAIATQRPYREVYDLINAYAKRERTGTRKTGRSDARTGVYAATLRRLAEREYGATWTPTMTIGSGTSVHLRADELPGGRLVARVSKHYTAVIDGIVRDNHDPTRAGTRAVYGYLTFPDQC